MKKRFNVVLVVLVLGVHASGCAQAWTPILNSKQAIDWSKAGVGEIPARPIHCADLNSTATLEQINAALASCPSGQAVFLAAGAYAIPGTVRVPSSVTLRGAGADKTILNATGTGGGDVISLGAGSVDFKPHAVTGGATARSTAIEVGDPAGIKAGMYLVIAEMNDAGFVSSAGSGGNCNWCDGGWTDDGSLARGQIVTVAAVHNKAITISPELYSSYTNLPVAVAFTMSASYAGVEDLQVYANHSGYDSNFGMSECTYCWIRGVESNYADGDHVEVYWGFHDEIRDSYFSNAYVHGPGRHDSDLQIGFKTTASLLENNIIERTHVAVMLEWGAAGNVIAYNYTMGEFDSGATNLVIGGIDFHGAHPQFNLLEGNVVTQINQDSVWGTSSHSTAFRNWVVGTNRICRPVSVRGTVSCSAENGHYGFQAARAIELTYLATANNFIANVVGSAEMQSLKGYNNSAEHLVSIEYPAPRNYDAVAYEWTFGYGRTGDDGSGTGCAGGNPPCHRAGTSATNFLHGNFSSTARASLWAQGVRRELPASFYLMSKPAWWGALPFPATGPDVVGGFGPGRHSYGNPAEACYRKVMGGSDGGAGGPLVFNANRCYGIGISLVPDLEDNRKATAGIAPQDAVRARSDREVR